MSRLEILENSLAKKESKFDKMLNNHFADVKSANGQPLNDKRNGLSTLNRWERQNDALRNQNKEIEKTKEALRKERNKVEAVEYFNEDLPEIFTKLINEKKIIQWRRHPRFFFVNGVEKARISLSDNRRGLDYRYLELIPTPEQRKLFVDIYNEIANYMKEMNGN